MSRRLTTEEWVVRAVNKHGEKYNYSRIEYVNSKTKVLIGCPVHGESSQVPAEHLRTSGCAECGREIAREKSILGLEKWIERAVEKHGDFYDYSESNYINFSTKIRIICPEHGPFFQWPQNHTDQGKGCPECGKIKARKASIESWKKRKKTTAQFISEAKEVHGNRFDYSSTTYMGVRNKVDISCPVHGLVSTYPNIHIRGHGCPICGKSASGRAKALTTEEWVVRAESKHGERFDYSKSSYINQNTNVNIICPTHGEFSQLPMVHIGSHGCPECGMSVGLESRRTSVEDFVKSAIGVHGDTYDYSMVEYVNSKTKVLIGCPVHGFFKGIPETHVNRGQGCPNCVGRGLSTDDWIERFQHVHGSRYDYADFEFNGATQKSSITCKHHGEFLQRPSSHYNGRGCPECGVIERASNQSMGLAEFEKRGRKKFGMKFDYSNVDYKNKNTPVEISCEEHGPFTQRPDVHLRSSTGCVACTMEMPRGPYQRSSSGARYTTESWIAKATEAHGGFYDYSKVEYGKSSDLLTIICPEHGEFRQLATNHVKGVGCWNCYKARASSLQRMSKEEMIEKCKTIHGDYYDYSKVEYVNSKTKFSLVCPIHGEFETDYSLHYHQRCGCSGCAKHGYDEFAPGYYYVHNILNEHGDVIFIKGGISNDPESRFKRWKTAIKSMPRHRNHQPVVVHRVWFENGVEALDLEKALLEVDEIRYPPVPGMDGGTELFRTDPLIYAIEAWSLDLDFQYV